MIILKVTKKQSLTLSLRNAICEKPEGGIKLTLQAPPPPPPTPPHPPIPPTPAILELSKLIHRIDRKWMTASCDLVFALTQEKNGTTNFLKNYNFLKKFGVLFVLKFRVLQIKA